MQPPLLRALGLILGLLLSFTAAAADLTDLVRALSQGSFDDRSKAIAALAASGDPRAVAPLGALNAGNLFVRKAEGDVVIARKDGTDLTLLDPVTGAVLGTAPEAALDRIRVNNRVRRDIEAALGSMTLLNPDARIRRDAAAAVFKSRDPATLPTLDLAIAAETDAGILLIMRQARAATLLASDAADADKIAAIAVIQERASATRSISSSPSATRRPVPSEAAVAAARVIERDLAIWEIAQNVWYGLSLGSVLLLAAIGLAITFGVMGVINMAHGEMVMIGAYVTFMVQELIRRHAPGLFDLSLIIALPLAFLIAGAIGALIERGIIRWLYGRPLETLLATWGCP